MPFFRFETQALQNGIPIPRLSFRNRPIAYAIIKRAKAGWTIAAPASSHEEVWVMRKVRAPQGRMPANGRAG